MTKSSSDGRADRDGAVRERTDVLVVGGGIAGLLTAWNLAEAGADVTLVEAGELGAAASGANAGSLHLQIQHPEFVAFGEAWARRYGPCLGLLRDAIALWQALPERVGEDLDVKLGGGLVVARTAGQMAAIRAKAAVEAEFGVTTHILDRDELRAEAPYMERSAIGAGFCPEEGKANPLRATPAVAAAAKRAGARILRATRVTALARDGDAYRVTTTRGTVTAGRIVNAAGAQAAELAAMLGIRLDIGGFPLQVTVTEPVAPLVPHLVYSAAGKLSLKQAANGACIIGGGWPARVRADGGLATDPASLAGNMAMAASVVPAIAGARVVRSWTAWVNGTPDWQPILGEVPGHPGFICALFPWVGFSAAPMTAQIAADVALGRKPSWSEGGLSRLAG